MKGASSSKQLKIRKNTGLFVKEMILKYKLNETVEWYGNINEPKMTHLLQLI